ncbi:MAG: prepilin-type N-terminal cleavage/methylation domain-containing protein [Pirellulaceae bacterium]
MNFSSKQRHRSTTGTHTRNRSRSASKRGLTLIELVVGLVLLATVLVSILLASARYEKSSRLAKNRRQAVQLADNLLASWFDSPRGIPIQAKGRFGIEDFVWQTQLVRNDQLFGRGVRIVRLDVSKVAMPGTSTLLSIELVQSEDN